MKRYEINHDPQDEEAMVEHPKGDYVLHSDHAAAVARLERERDAMHAKVCALLECAADWSCGDIGNDGETIPPPSLRQWVDHARARHAPERDFPHTLRAGARACGFSVPDDIPAELVRANDALATARAAAERMRQCDGVLAEVVAERARQDAKWGQQDHPSVCRVLTEREGGCSPLRMCEEYEIPGEARAKFLCQHAARQGECTFAHIAVEELSEAVSARDDAERRGELVQLAAVCVQWIERIDRAALGEKG